MTEEKTCDAVTPHVVAVNFAVCNYVTRNDGYVDDYYWVDILQWQNLVVF